MNKICLNLLLAISLLGVAQTADAQAYKDSKYYNPQTGQLEYGYREFPAKYYGFRIGLNFAHIASDDNAHGYDNRTGLNLGFVYGYNLTDQAPLYFESGFEYVQKGGKSTESGVKKDYNLDYLQLPLVVKYFVDFDNGLTLQPFCGCYFACGIGGSIKDYSLRESTDSFSASDDAYRRWDAGLRVGCGVGYQVLYAELVYDYGLANISHDAFNAAHNRGVQINIGVNF